jgi:FlaA1/EpsC-like NDP-sugar epimerase
MLVTNASARPVSTRSVDRGVRAPRLAAVVAGWIVPCRRPLIVAFHLVLIAVAHYLALWLRYDGEIPEVARATFQQALPWMVFVYGGTFAPFGVYHGLWRYTGLWELQQIVAAVVTGSLICYGAASWLGMFDYGRSVPAIGAVLLVALTGGARLVSPSVARLSWVKGRQRVLIVGAGDAGEMMVREMKRSHSREPIGFVDDDRAKAGLRIHGVPVLGSREDLPRLMTEHKPHEVLIAAPVVREIVEALRPFPVSVTRVPGPEDIHAGAAVTARPVSVEDLLARPSIDLDDRPVRRLIEGRSVMVTGAGGSIGSELCRQIAALRPSALVLYERYENNLFAIATDLLDRYPSNGIHPVIGDITDVPRLDAVLTEYRPAIIFHAAAHKHVPLMEHNVCEAVKNNVVGSRVLMEAAERHHVDRFILISTDKAVNPTSVMGATKRVAERILQLHAGSESTSFSIVRFGNVLGSNGSVVPRFLEQIRAGGPVTITHPAVRRFFMSIPEAARLVLHAAAQKTSGSVYVLEMGEQIKLVDLARNLIRLSGSTPDEQIGITFVGLRPGEKLFEELVGPDEIVRRGATRQILEVTPRELPDPRTLADQVACLERMAFQGNRAEVMKLMRKIVPEFSLPGSEPTLEALPKTVEELAAVRHEGRRRVCGKCGSERLRRARGRSVPTYIRSSLTHRRLYRCLTCGSRAWVPAGDTVHAPSDAWTTARSREWPHPDLSSIDRALGVPQKVSSLSGQRALDERMTS